MQVTVSRVSPVKVEVKISVPREQISRALSKAYTDLGKQAQIRGFRKGKVPLALLKQYFGAKVTQEVTGKLVEETLPQALVEQKLEPVTQPQVQPGEFADNADWVYTAQFEVRPEVGELGLADIALQREVFTVTDADVAHQIEHLRENQATLRTPDPIRPVKAGDTVTVDYDVTIDGAVRTDLQMRARTIEVGVGKLLKELDAGLHDAVLNEPKEIPVHFADDHAREDIRGKDAVLKVVVTEVREKLLPELDDEFAKDVNAESLDALRTRVRGELEADAKSASENKLRQAAVDALVAKHPIDVPPSLVENAVAALARDLAQSLRVRNEPLNVEAVLATAREQAEKRVRAGLLLGELARQNALNVTEADLNAQIETMAKETGKAAARLRVEYREPKKREGLANAILEDKVLALLISKVSVTEVPATAPLHNHDHAH